VYQWWVFVHLVGVFAFLAMHGVSMSVSLRLRTEREPRRVTELLMLSAWANRYMYVGLALLLLGGIVAGVQGDWWSYGWIWASIVVLVLATLAMYALATPYYRRVGVVARAKAEGQTAVTDQQFDQVLRSNRSTGVVAVGALALLVILYFMIFKPSLGLAPAATPAPPASNGGTALSISAKALAFDTSRLSAPAGRALEVRFDNQDAGVPHNVAVYTDASASTVLLRGQVVTGVRTVTYRVPALDAGSYFFRCDVHPAQMTGTLVVR
jgi:plastocyanin